MKLPDIKIKRAVPRLVSETPQQAVAGITAATRGATKVAGAMFSYMDTLAENEAAINANERKVQAQSEIQQMRKNLQQQYLDDPEKPLSGYMDDVGQGEANIVDRYTSNVDNRTGKYIAQWKDTMRSGVNTFEQDAQWYTRLATQRSAESLTRAASTTSAMILDDPSLFDDSMRDLDMLSTQLSFPNEEARKNAVGTVSKSYVKARLDGLLNRGLTGIVKTELTNSEITSRLSVDQLDAYTKSMNVVASEQFHDAGMAKRAEVFNQPDDFWNVLEKGRADAKKYAQTTDVAEVEVIDQWDQDLSLSYLDGLLAAGRYNDVTEVITSGKLNDTLDSSHYLSYLNRAAAGQDTKTSTSISELLAKARSDTAAAADGNVIDDTTQNDINTVLANAQELGLSNDKKASLRMASNDLAVARQGRSLGGDLNAQTTSQMRTTIDGMRSWRTGTAQEGSYQTRDKVVTGYETQANKLIDERRADPAGAVVNQTPMGKDSMGRVNSALVLLSEAYTTNNPRALDNARTEVQQAFAEYQTIMTDVQVGHFENPIESIEYIPKDSAMLQQLTSTLVEGTADRQMAMLGFVADAMGPEVASSFTRQMTDENPAVAASLAARMLNLPLMSYEILNGAKIADKANAPGSDEVSRAAVFNAVGRETEFVRNSLGDRAWITQDVVANIYYSRANDAQRTALDAELVNTILDDVQGPSVEVSPEINFRTISYRQPDGTFTTPSVFKRQLTKIVNDPTVLSESHTTQGRMYIGGKSISADEVISSGGLRLIPAGDNGVYRVELDSATVGEILGDPRVTNGSVRREDGGDWLLDMRKVPFPSTFETIEDAIGGLGVTAGASL